MADQNTIKSQLENNPASFNLEEIKGIPEELDKVINALVEIRSHEGRLNRDQQKIYNSAVKYRKELEKTTEEIEKGGNAMQRWARGANDLSRDIQGLGSALQAPFDAMNKLGGAWGKADQAANDFGKTVGGNTKAVAQLRDESIKFANDVHIGEKYNASIKEMIELQQKYVSTVGRNLQISDKQRETLLATSKLMGSNTTEFAAKLENMGIGLEKSGDIAAKMFNEASKSGVSFEKYSQSVTQNLTKVQSYGFKNGVEGLTAMAKRAAEVNLNIGEAFKVADKIQTGGIESAIKMGANLQVLGGSFARMGDPMGLLYQGINDMEGLQDRMIKMFSGLGEFVDGQVKISGANRLRVNAAAQAMGISSDEMFNMINRQAVRSRVEDQMKNVTVFQNDAELKELVANTATLNKEGQAVVNINGQQKTLDEVTSADKKYLQDLQKSESEDIKDIAQILRGYTDVQSGFEKEVENKKAQAFSNIGKATKMIYDKLGQSNVALEIIKDSVLAMTVANAFGSMFGGIGGMFGGRRGGFGGVRGGVATGRASAPAPAGNALPAGYQTLGSKRVIMPNGQVYNTQTGKLLSKEDSAALISRNAAKGGSAAGGAGSKIANFAGSTAGKVLGGGAMGGAFAALGYLADGSWQGDRSQKNKAIAGTAGAAIGGALGSFAGPIGTMIGTEAGKLLGEVVGGKLTETQTKLRSEKKASLTRELGKGSEKAEAFESLKGDYSRKQLQAIKDALKDGKITDGELSPKIMKKMAESGDKELIEKFGSKGAKAKMNEQIEKINAKIDSGNFNMDTGEFSIGNANFGTIEPIAMARGGKLNGPSDINGPGMPIQGTNIVVGGGEYVVNAEATKKNEPILDKINSGATFKMAAGGIMPTPVVKYADGGKLSENVGNPGADKKMQIPVKISNIIPNILKSPMAPLPVRAAMGAMGMLENRRGGIDKMEVAPIKLDVSGTIKLDAGGKQVDLDSIINNPAFLTELSQMIERRLSDNVNGGNFKETRKNKRHNF